MEIIFLQTIILGIIEGLTEFIPVSSTAHLLLAGHVLGIPQGPFLEALAIGIQSGAILAAIWYFWRTIWTSKALIGKVALAFLPTALAGLLLYPLIKTFFTSTLVIALALIIGGVVFLFIRTVDTAADVQHISYKDAFIIGCIQIMSFIPGVSRAGATLIGGTLLGIPRSIIVPFSFLLAIPTILGASVVELQHVEGLHGMQWFLIALGTVIAFATAMLSIRFFINLLTKKPLSWFGWYRIALGVLVLFFLV